jgi:8-O-methyltransferase
VTTTTTTTTTESNGAAAAADAVPSSQPIMMLINGFIRSRVTLSAVELDVFTALSDARLTCEELRERLGLHPRGAADFFDALVAMELLERDEEGRYRNAPVTAYYLDRNKPTYIGYPEWVLHSGYQSWMRFTDALRTGLRQDPRGTGGGGDLFDLYDDPAEVDRTMRGADTHNGVLGADLAKVFDWSRYRDFVDIGGARGNVPAILVRHHPHLQGINFDLPIIEPYFQRHMAELGIGPEQVRFHAGDFSVDPFPEADVMICGHTLHNHNVEQRQMIIQKAFDALRPGGAMLIYDVLFDEDRRSLVPLLWSLTMLVQTAEGAEYSVSECTGWAREAGFGTVTSTQISDMNILVVARKDA